MIFLDTRNGQAAARRPGRSTRPSKPKDDFAGAGIWSTPAIDPRRKVAYVGHGQPVPAPGRARARQRGAQVRHRPASRRFGEILGSYKGNVDEYFPGLSEMPVLRHPRATRRRTTRRGSAPAATSTSTSAPRRTCSRGPDGRKLVGAGQKSGVYHVFDAKTMEPVWTQIVGPPTAVGGIVGSTAYDGERRLRPDHRRPATCGRSTPASGSHRWVGPDRRRRSTGATPVAVANGVVYTVDLTGFLDAFDADTGALLPKQPLAVGDAAARRRSSWGGVSVARNTVYAAVGIGGSGNGAVIAYRLPE